MCWQKDEQQFIPALALASTVVRKAKRKQTMIDAIDIQERIKSDFGAKASEVFRIFDEAISRTDYLNNNRIIRCIIFLSDKDISNLEDYIEKATNDPRDVMLWAEYTNRGQGEKIKRIRDFNKPFDKAHQNVID